MREASIYHFSDKWKDIMDIKTAKKTVTDVRKRIQWEKDNRKELRQTYADMQSPYVWYIYKESQY